MRLALIAALLVSPAWAAETGIEFDALRTVVEFTLGDVLHTVHGTFKLRRGSIVFDPVTGKAGGSIVVDARSGDSGSSARDKRMHKNILESERFPEIAFVPDRVAGKLAPEGASEVQVHGQFRIHGEDHELTLPFQVQTAAGQLTATTHFGVPYVKWGMKNPSTFLLKVNDTVDITIRAMGRVSGSAP